MKNWIYWISVTLILCSLMYHMISQKDEIDELKYQNNWLQEQKTPENLQKRISVLEDWISAHEPYTWFRSTGEPFLNFDEPPHPQKSAYPIEVTCSKFTLESSANTYMLSMPILECPECRTVRKDPAFIKICPSCTTHTAAPK